LQLSPVVRSICLLRKTTFGKIASSSLKNLS
jgi:hypothetical protein